MARTPDQIAISDAELAPFVSDKDAASRACGLLQQQRGVWDLLRTGYDSLQSVKTRVFEFDGFHIKVQFNPGRMTSTAAKVDPNSIRERKCFLCPDNLPPPQRGIPSDGDYLVLCNPFPIFPEHFTIASLHHTPQVIHESFASFLGLTRDLGSRYTVFYNGPRCGASAPDHLHFQAGNRSFLPIDAEFAALKDRGAGRLFESDSLRVRTVEKSLRHVIAFESADAGLLRRAFDALYAVLQDGAPEGGEPMLNVLGFYTRGEWQVLVFPRAKHRPSFYFKEGDEKLLISPAAVELGGICTTPREEDFAKVTREHILQLYNEVCVPPEHFASITARLAPKLAALA
jgi:ATP adenylyltransferase/5',5'''-P-1,P-4-tetraphosphate phosphorylase II